MCRTFHRHLLLWFPRTHESYWRQVYNVRNLDSHLKHCYLRTTDVCSFHRFRHFSWAGFLQLQLLFLHSLLPSVAASSGVIPLIKVKTDVVV